MFINKQICVKIKTFPHSAEGCLEEYPY